MTAISIIINILRGKKPIKSSSNNLSIQATKVDCLNLLTADEYCDAERPYISNYNSIT
jgi:hypothetical protein